MLGQIFHGARTHACRAEDIFQTRGSHTAAKGQESQSTNTRAVCQLVQ